MFMRFFTSFLTIVTFVLLGDVVKAQTLPAELLVSSVSGCRSFDNFISYIQVSRTQIVRTILKYADPLCSELHSTKTTEYKIEQIIPTGTSSATYAKVMATNDGNLFEVDLLRDHDMYDISAIPRTNPDGTRPPSWGSIGWVWDGTTSLISRHLANKDILGEKCFASDAWGPKFKSYRISINIFPTHLFVHKYWFKEDNCLGIKVSLRDDKVFWVRSAEPIGEKESVIAKSGERIEIAKSNGKWVLSGLPTLEGRYSVPPKNKYSRSSSYSKEDPNAWKTVDPLATQKD